jgi:hypothetical protein
MAEPRFLAQYKDTWDSYIKTVREAVVNGYWQNSNPNRLKFKVKKEDFDHTQNMTEEMVEALQVLISVSEGHRALPGVQPCIKNLVEGINIHLERIKKYLLKNNPSGFKTKEDQREEAKFQRVVFKGKRTIEDILKDLNIENNMDNVEIEFHSQKVASLPMKTPIEMQYQDIKAKIESLDIDWELIKDKEMAFNYPKKDIPDWNYRKHFFEQETESLQYFVSEFNKFKKGIDIDGYFMHPWLYFHLNYFKTPVPIVNPDGTKEEKIMLPPLRDNEWYFAEILKRVEARGDCGVLVYGSRRFAKSSIIASYLLWKALISPNGNITVTSGNDKDLGDLTDKMDTAIKSIHPAFKPETNAENWSKEVEFGLKSKTGSKIKLCDARITNLDSGSKGASQKTAGGAPVAFVIEEIGKFSWRAAFDTAIPSFETLDGWKTIPILIGTGGEESLSSDAEKVLSNPEQNDLMEIDWDLLEWQVPKEAITWVRRPFGWFVPAQMGYKTGYKRIKRTMSDFLKIESKLLDKIDILQTDWINNTKICRDRREKLKSDKEKHQKEVVFYPLEVDECFMSAKENPYPASGIKRHKERLQSEGDKVYGLGRRIELFRNRDDSSKIEYELSEKEVNEYPHNGRYIDCAGVLYEDFPDTKPTDIYRYVAGHDGYKQEQSDGDSIGTFMIFDRLKRKIVYSLATRPDPSTKFFSEMHMALDAWNAKCFMENEDIDIKKYFDRITATTAELYLHKGFDAYDDFSKFQNSTRKFGWRPDKNTVPIVRGYTLDYVKDEMDFFDKNDNITHTVSGYERIEDIQLLEEMIKYKPDGNFDRLVAFGSCLAIDFYLTSQWRTPLSTNKKINEQTQEQFKPKPQRPKFTKKRYSSFSK